MNTAEHIHITEEEARSKLIAGLADVIETVTTPLLNEIERLRAAIRDISQGKSSTYKARNGREVGIEADDGEKVWLVHSDLIHAAEVAADIVKGDVLP